MYGSGGNLGAGIGSTAGAVGGQAIGIPAPIGAFVGGKIGGFLGGLFDDDEKKDSRRPQASVYSPSPVYLNYEKGGAIAPIAGGRAFIVKGGSHESGNDVTVPQEMAPGSHAKVEGGETIDYLQMGKGGKVFMDPKGRSRFTKAKYERGGPIKGVPKGKVAVAFSTRYKLPGSDVTFAKAHQLLLDKGAGDDKIMELANLQESVTSSDLKATRDGKELFYDGGELDNDLDLPLEDFSDMDNTPIDTTNLYSPSSGGFNLRDAAEFVPSLVNTGAAIFAPKPDVAEFVPADRSALSAISGMKVRENIDPQLAAISASQRAVMANPAATTANLQAAHSTGIQQASKELARKSNVETERINARQQLMARHMNALAISDARRRQQSELFNTQMSNRDKDFRTAAIMEAGIQGAEAFQKIDARKRQKLMDKIALTAAMANMDDHRSRLMWVNMFDEESQRAMGFDPAKIKVGLAPEKEEVEAGVQAVATGSEAVTSETPQATPGVIGETAGTGPYQGVRPGSIKSGIPTAIDPVLAPTPGVIPPPLTPTVTPEKIDRMESGEVGIFRKPPVVKPKPKRRTAEDIEGVPERPIPRKPKPVIELPPDEELQPEEFDIRTAENTEQTQRLRKARVPAAFPSTYPYFLGNTARYLTQNKDIDPITGAYTGDKAGVFTGGPTKHYDVAGRDISAKIERSGDIRDITKKEGNIPALKEIRERINSIIPISKTNIVKVEGATEEALRILPTVKSVYDSLGHGDISPGKLEITGFTEMKSKEGKLYHDPEGSHPKGNGVDFRIKHVPDEDRVALATKMQQRLNSQFPGMYRVLLHMGGGKKYEAVTGKTLPDKSRSDAAHLHIGYNPDWVKRNGGAPRRSPAPNMTFGSRSER
jgi:hypothetical protein